MPESLNWPYTSKGIKLSMALAMIFANKACCLSCHFDVIVTGPHNSIDMFVHSGVIMWLSIMGSHLINGCDHTQVPAPMCLMHI